MKRNAIVLLALLLLLTALLAGCDERSMKALDEKVASLQEKIKNGPQDVKDWVDEALDVESDVAPGSPSPSPSPSPEAT